MDKWTWDCLRQMQWKSSNDQLTSHALDQTMRDKTPPPWGLVWTGTATKVIQMLYRTCFECRIAICTLSLCSASLKNTFLSFKLKLEEFLEGVSRGSVFSRNSIRHYIRTELSGMVVTSFRPPYWSSWSIHVIDRQSKNQSEFSKVLTPYWVSEWVSDMIPTIPITLQQARK